MEQEKRPITLDHGLFFGHPESPDRAKEARFRRFLKPEHGIPPHGLYRRVTIRIRPGLPGDVETLKNPMLTIYFEIFFSYMFLIKFNQIFFPRLYLFQTL